MNEISSLILPIIVLFVIIYGIKKQVNVYDVFVEGAKESFDITLNMFPSLLAMILGINIFINSGIIMHTFKYLSQVLNIIKLPIEIIPLIIMRPISGSSSLAILNNILENFGPDSFLGTLSSVIQGSTDTTFYVLTLYFGSVGIKKIKYAMKAGLLSDLVGIIAGIMLVNIFF